MKTMKTMKTIRFLRKTLLLVLFVSITACSTDEEQLFPEEQLKETNLRVNRDNAAYIAKATYADILPIKKVLARNYYYNKYFPSVALKYSMDYNLSEVVFRKEQTNLWDQFLLEIKSDVKFINIEVQMSGPGGDDDNPGGW